MKYYISIYCLFWECTPKFKCCRDCNLYSNYTHT